MRKANRDTYITRANSKITVTMGGVRWALIRVSSKMEKSVAGEL